MVFPVQLEVYGVMVTLDEIVPPVVCPGKAAISPVPLAGKPVLVLSFVQSNEVPVVVLVKFTAVKFVPTHTV